MSVVLLCSFMSMDQIEKRSFTLFSAGNGDWGPIFGWSCNCKDFKDELPSCKSCYNKLIKGINYETCQKCLNWQIERANYSKELVASANGYVTKPFKLTLKLQESMSKEIHNNLVEGKLSRKMATLQLKTLAHNVDTIKPKASTTSHIARRHESHQHESCRPRLFRGTPAPDHRGRPPDQLGQSRRQRRRRPRAAPGPRRPGR